MNSLIVLALMAGAVRFEGRVVEPPCVASRVEERAGDAPRVHFACEQAQTLPQVTLAPIKETPPPEKPWVVRLDYL